MSMAEMIEELSTEQEERFKFHEMTPSEAGLEVVLKEASLWSEYVISLGLTIDQVKFLNQQIQQPGLRGLLALNHWKKGHCGDSYPTTWGHLLGVIAQCPEYGPIVAEELKEKIVADAICELSERKDTLVHAVCDCFSCTTFSPPASDGVFDECIVKLKEFYLKDSIIHDDLLEMSPELQYIPLSYIKMEEKKERSGAKVEHDDIIRMVAHGSKCVLLQGYPGSGKTTTLRKICHDFAESKLPPEIKVVVRVVLGELQEGTKVKMEDLIQTCISEEHIDLIENITSFAREHNGEGILFLFDGFDELAIELQKKSLVASILIGKAYPKSSYIITTRPSATAQLPQQAIQQMDHKVETQGFTMSMMNQFINQWFRTRPETGKKLSEIIFKNSKLQDMCRNPLTVLIACTLASEEQMPERMTELLKSLMCLLGNCYLEKNGKDPFILQWEDLEEQCSSVRELAELALHGFCNGKYTFTDQDTSLPHRPSKLDHMGLFTVTSKKKRGVSVKSYRFFHLIVQEFLAAYALLLKSPEDQAAFWKEHLKEGPIIDPHERTTRIPRLGLLNFQSPGPGQHKLEDRPSLLVNTRFETLFEFYAGLTNLQDVSIQQLLFQLVYPDKGLVLDGYTITSLLFRIAYESQNEQFTKQLFSLYNPSLTVIFILSRELQAQMWCLQHLVFSSLSIEATLDKETLEIMKQVFDTSKGKLEEFSLTTYNHDKRVFDLEMIPTCAQMKVLRLGPYDGYFDYINFSSQSFVNILDRLTSLQTLSLTAIKLIDMDVETVVGDISRGIQQLKNLSDVQLKYGSDEVTTGVIGGLVCHECISKLTVEGTRWGIQITQQSLVKFLNKSTSLQTLSLKRLHLLDMDVDTVVGDISRGIQQFKNLSNVRLEECCNELTRGVVEGLKDPKCLSKLTIAGDQRGNIHISQSSLVNILNKSTRLQYLFLWYIQLLDMDMETVIGDISKGTEELKNLLHVGLEDCCDELTRGVVDGIVVNQCIEEFTLHNIDNTCSEKLMKSLENIRTTRGLKRFSFSLHSGEISSHYLASFTCGFFEKRAAEKLDFSVPNIVDSADGVDEELLTRLESFIRDNNTMKELKLQCYRPKSPVPANVAAALLKGAVHNKGLEMMRIDVPNTVELHRLEDEVKLVNKNLKLIVEFCKESSSHWSPFTISPASSLLSSPLQIPQQSISGLSLPLITPLQTTPKEKSIDSSRYGFGGFSAGLVTIDSDNEDSEDDYVSAEEGLL